MTFKTLCKVVLVAALPVLLNLLAAGVIEELYLTVPFPATVTHCHPLSHHLALRAHKHAFVGDNKKARSK